MYASLYWNFCQSWVLISKSALPALLGSAVLIASLFCILYSFCSALASLHLTKHYSLFIGIFVLLNLQPWFEFIFHHCMAGHNALFGCLLSWNCGISYVSTSGYFDYWLYANPLLMLVPSFGRRHTWEYKYLGFTSSVLGALLRSHSKQILRILTTQWNRGLVAILNLGVNRMR